MVNRGYFVIADITGYTAFLTGSELEHAQDILKSLFDCLLDNIKAPLIISNFQGDAILTYAPEGSFTQGQILLETIENIYCAFAKKLEMMHQNTTCTCKACMNIPKLDLKLFVHFGEFLIQDMRGKAELSGPDVIIAHRMMKNDVKEKTGLKAYTLFSEKAVNQLGLQDFVCEMHAHKESYEHIGDVPMYAYCLKTMWEREREKRRDLLKPEEVWFTIEGDIAAPPSVVWGYYADPQRRVQAAGANAMTLLGAKSGRIGAGSTVHCAHGNNETVDFVILDWKPFEHITERLAGLPMGMSARTTLRFQATAAGSHLSLSVAGFEASNFVGRLAAKAAMVAMKKSLIRDYENMFTNFGAMIKADEASGKLVLPTAN